MFWIILEQKLENTSLKEEFYEKEYGITSLTVCNLENNELFQLLSESKDELGAFKKAYEWRLAEQKGKAPGQNKEVRGKLQEIYDFLVDFTAINVYAYPDKKQYTNLHDHLNAIRSRYKKLTPKKTKQEAVGEEK